jgi:hypothetical protein
MGRFTFLDENPLSERFSFIDEEDELKGPRFEDLSPAEEAEILTGVSAYEQAKHAAGGVIDLFRGGTQKEVATEEHLKAQQRAQDAIETFGYFHPRMLALSDEAWEKALAEYQGKEYKPPIETPTINVPYMTQPSEPDLQRDPFSYYAGMQKAAQEEERVKAEKQAREETFGTPDQPIIESKGERFGISPEELGKTGEMIAGAGEKAIRYPMIGATTAEEAISRDILTFPGKAQEATLRVLGIEDTEFGEWMRENSPLSAIERIGQNISDFYAEAREDLGVEGIDEELAESVGHGLAIVAEFALLGKVTPSVFPRIFGNVAPALAGRLQNVMTFAAQGAISGGSLWNPDMQDVGSFFGQMGAGAKDAAIFGGILEGAHVFAKSLGLPQLTRPLVSATTAGVKTFVDTGDPREAGKSFMTMLVIDALGPHGVLKKGQAKEFTEKVKTERQKVTDIKESFQREFEEAQRPKYKGKLKEARPFEDLQRDMNDLVEYLNDQAKSGRITQPDADRLGSNLWEMAEQARVRGIDLRPRVEILDEISDRFITGKMVKEHGFAEGTTPEDVAITGSARVQAKGKLMEVGIRVTTSTDTPITRQSMEELAHVYGILLESTNPHVFGQVESFYRAAGDPRTPQEAFAQDIANYALKSEAEAGKRFTEAGVQKGLLDQVSTRFKKWASDFMQELLYSTNATDHWTDDIREEATEFAKGNWARPMEAWSKRQIRDRLLDIDFEGIDPKVKKELATEIDEYGWDYLKFIERNQNRLSLTENSKMLMSIDLTKSCPNRRVDTAIDPTGRPVLGGKKGPGACAYCYVEQPRTRKELGIKQVLSPPKVIDKLAYTNEILEMPDSLVRFVNQSMGGIRMFAFGDYLGEHRADVTRILNDARSKKLKIKAITKQPEFIRDFADEYKDVLNINISVDNLPPALKRAMSMQEAWELAKDRPNVVMRVVALNRTEAELMGTDPRVHILTLYHGDTNFRKARPGDNPADIIIRNGEKMIRTDKLFKIIKHQNPQAVEAMTEKGLRDFLDTWENMPSKFGKNDNPVFKRLSEKFKDKICCGMGRCWRDPNLCGFGKTAKAKATDAEIKKFEEAHIDEISYSMRYKPHQKFQSGDYDLLSRAIDRWNQDPKLDSFDRATNKKMKEILAESFKPEEIDRVIAVRKRLHQVVPEEAKAGQYKDKTYEPAEKALRAKGLKVGDLADLSNTALAAHLRKLSINERTTDMVLKLVRQNQKAEAQRTWIDARKEGLVRVKDRLNIQVTPDNFAEAARRVQELSQHQGPGSVVRVFYSVKFDKALETLPELVHWGRDIFPSEFSREKVMREVEIKNIPAGGTMRVMEKTAPSTGVGEIPRRMRNLAKATTIHDETSLATLSLLRQYFNEPGFKYLTINRVEYANRQPLQKLRNDGEVYITEETTKKGKENLLVIRDKRGGKHVVYSLESSPEGDVTNPRLHAYETADYTKGQEAAEQRAGFDARNISEDSYQKVMAALDSVEKTYDNWLEDLTFLDPKQDAHRFKEEVNRIVGRVKKAWNPGDIEVRDATKPVPAMQWRQWLYPVSELAKYDPDAIKINNLMREALISRDADLAEVRAEIDSAFKGYNLKERQAFMKEREGGEGFSKPRYEALNKRITKLMEKAKEIIQKDLGVDTSNWGTDVETYLPHLFVGQWTVTDGGKFLNSFRTQDEAIKWAEQYWGKHPKAKLRVGPKSEELLVKSTETILSRKAYGRFVREVEKATTLEGEELRAVIKGVAAPEPRAKFFGSLKGRTRNLTDYLDDPQLALNIYWRRLLAKRYMDPAVKESTKLVDNLPTDNGYKSFFVDYIRDVRRDGFNPQDRNWKSAKAASYVTRIESILKLGWKPWTAVVNRLQPLFTVYPYVGSKFFLKGWRFMHSAEGKAVADELNIQRYEPRIVEGAEGKPTAAASQMKFYAQELKGPGNKWYSPMKMFSISEISSRRHAGSSFYLYARERLGMSHQEAIDFAQHGLAGGAIPGIQGSMYDYTLAGLPRSFRSPLGRMVGQFRQFTINYLTQMKNITQRGLKDPWGKPHENASMNATVLARTIGAHLLMGGISMVPYKERIPVLGGFFTYLQVNHPLIAHGVLGYLFGADIGSRSGIGDFIPRNTIDFLGVSVSDLRKILTMADQIIRGEDAGDQAIKTASGMSPQFRMAYEVYKVLKGDDEYRSIYDRNRLQTRDLTTKEKALLMSGIQPLSFTQTKQLLKLMDSDVKQIQKMRRQRIDKIIKVMGSPDEYFNDPNRALKAQELFNQYATDVYTSPHLKLQKYVKFLNEAAKDLGRDSDEFKALKDAVMGYAGAVPLNITDKDVWNEYSKKYYQTTEERKLKQMPKILRYQYLDSYLKNSENLLNLADLEDRTEDTQDLVNQISGARVNIDNEETRPDAADEEILPSDVPDMVVNNAKTAATKLAVAIGFTQPGPVFDRAGNQVYEVSPQEAQVAAAKFTTNAGLFKDWVSKKFGRPMPTVHDALRFVNTLESKTFELEENPRTAFGNVKSIHVDMVQKKLDEIPVDKRRELAQIHLRIGTSRNSRVQANALIKQAQSILSRYLSVTPSEKDTLRALVYLFGTGPKAAVQVVRSTPEKPPEPKPVAKMAAVRQPVKPPTISATLEELTDPLTGWRA